ncbi:MAG: hypothetical protein JNM71_08095 [Flavobacterium lindanitolerans]|uniref:hypothetical protein n=1 Tax=Flavobacterium lindanitolerans TaxID=428988 RepID=UPI001A4FFD1C|nr:hypothetical protein [Flavobacterium lindanitolerans]MBL7867968.1 hypothetical protein [Flavobacterium lindanitolerans]
MMLQFTKYFILLFLFTAIGSFAQNTAINTGINTKNPGSRLTVNGSVAADYKIITGNAVLGYSDYYTAYNGNADAMLHLPPAGWGSLKGRVYAIKNTSSNSMLTVIPPAQEMIYGTANMSSVTVPPGYYVKLISRGTVTDTTWELLAIMDGKVTSEAVKKALDYSFGMDIGGYPISPTEFIVSNNNSVLLPESQTMFTMPVAKPVFLNVAIGLADFTYPRVFSKSPYYRCELIIDGVATNLFQIAQQQHVGSSLRFNISGVFNLSAGSHGIWVNITRWNDDGHTGTQRLLVLSVVYDGVYLD